MRKKTQITLRSRAFTTQSRSSHLEAFCRKNLCGQYRKIQRKTLVPASLFSEEPLLNLPNLCLSYLTFHISYFINLAFLPAFVSFDSFDLKLSCSLQIGLRIKSQNEANFLISLFLLFRKGQWYFIIKCVRKLMAKCVRFEHNRKILIRHNNKTL